MVRHPSQVFLDGLYCVEWTRPTWRGSRQLWCMKQCTRYCTYSSGLAYLSMKIPMRELHGPSLCGLGVIWPCIRLSMLVSSGMVYLIFSSSPGLLRSLNQSRSSVSYNEAWPDSGTRILLICLGRMPECCDMTF